MLTSAASISILSACYLIHYTLFGNESILKWFQNRYNDATGQTRFVLTSRIFGAALFGLVPIIICLVINKPLSDIGLLIKPSFVTFFIVVAFSMIPILVNYFGAKNLDNLAMYPQIRAKTWNKKLILVSALSWVLYLLGYEIIIRGYFFFTCLDEMGLWPAIAVNASIYSLIHLPKGMKETIGAIPLGIVLCLITSYTGTIWAAFWIHCTLALTNEWFSIKYTKGIVFEK